jgi:hypothetical protein
LAVNWVSSSLSFFLSASTAAAYIFTAPNCTTTIISLGPPRALKCWNSVYCTIELQDFILRFNKNVFTLRIPLKERRGDRGLVKGGPKTEGWRLGFTFMDNSNSPKG